MSKRDEMAEKHGRDVFPVNWGNAELHRVNKLNAEASFKMGWDAATEAHAGLVDALRSIAEDERVGCDEFPPYNCVEIARAALAAHKGGERD